MHVKPIHRSVHTCPSNCTPTQTHPKPQPYFIRNKCVYYKSISHVSLYMCMCSVCVCEKGIYITQYKCPRLFLQSRDPKAHANPLEPCWALGPLSPSLRESSWVALPGPCGGLASLASPRWPPECCGLTSCLRPSTA